MKGKRKKVETQPCREWNREVEKGDVETEERERERHREKMWN